MSPLIGHAGIVSGTLGLGEFLKQWIRHSKRDDDGAIGDDPADFGARPKGDEALYSGIYVGVKNFLNTATSHTIEEMQRFANLRTPSGPGVHAVRTLVPLSCCDEAAKTLIKALGGEHVARRVVGGVKWWQVRGANGVDAEWITMKKDVQEAKKRYKMKQQAPISPPPEGCSSETNGIHDKEMDAMICILYLHGGGYYFGSVDQTRYSNERFARKIHGRVFAINYRLAPQYPFPCGLHDALAAYLFLIRPPAGSAHTAINPARIIISGDSAGGAMALALLQVIRDTNLPLPAGGVLISPWCDLTHSFPSIGENTKNDFIPECGLSFHKPSTLWPPPSSDISKPLLAPSCHGLALCDTSSHLGGPDSRNRVVVEMSDGRVEEIEEQLQFYTVNNLLNHPLVSPVTGYLGGLPPLLFTAGDEEVLRDEIIYTAHKAAYPEKYPVLSSSRLLYPHLESIEGRHKEPTSVHLQVYDATHHILPVLFMPTEPAKFCFRAIANFDTFVTDMKIPNNQSSFSSDRQSRTEANERVWRIPDVSPEFREDPSEKRTAGQPQVYEGIKNRSNWECRMIRERVSTSGVIRELEPEDELVACQMPHDRVGQLSETTVLRYTNSKRMFDQRFARTKKAIEDRRRRDLAKAKKKTINQVLDGGENPPPSSIFGRRDTEAARRLAARSF